MLINVLLFVFVIYWHSIFISCHLILVNYTTNRSKGQQGTTCDFISKKKQWKLHDHKIFTANRVIIWIVSSVQLELILMVVYGCFFFAAAAAAALFSKSRIQLVFFSKKRSRHCKLTITNGEVYVVLLLLLFSECSFSEKQLLFLLLLL